MMNSSSSFRPAMAAGALGLAALLLTPGAAHAVLYRAGDSAGSGAQTWQFNRGDDPDFSFVSARLGSGPEGLHGFVTLRRAQYTPQPKPVAEIVIDDVIVSGSGDFTTIQFGGTLSGGFSGVGNGSANLLLAITGSGVTQPPLTFSPVETFDFSSFDHPEAVEEPLYITRRVPVGRPFAVRAQLTVAAISFAGDSTFTTDFANSFLFDPESVFVLEPDFTVNSASWGLVNNALISALPTPAATPLFAASIGAMLLLLRRRAAC